jgi:NodT family efflux transporter outer membrane factor (OMF) lipoprotein
MKLKSSYAATGLAIALLSSCNPGPKYAKPPAQAPAAFKEAVPEQYKEGVGWKLAQPGDDVIRGKWWAMYNDPALNALEEQVRISNQNIISAEANFRAARALVASARSALFPTVTTVPAITNSHFSQTSRGSGGFSSSIVAGSIDTYSLPIDVSYELDLWHRIRNTVAANAFQAQASAADVATAILSTQAELAQDYFQARELDAQRTVLQNTVENYRRNVELTLSRFQGGIASEEDVAQAQTQLDTTTAQATDLGVARAQVEHAIATLIGKPASSFSLPVGEFAPKPPAVPVALPSELLERRPDIAAAERRVAAANAQIGVARAAYYPRLVLSASGGLQTTHFTQWFTWPSRFWSVGPQLSQTLWDGGARRALNEQAQASYEQTVANYRQSALNAFQGVEDNLSALRILSQEVVEQHTAIRSSGRFLDLSLTRYRGGVDSYLNVITAQNTVLTNQEAELQIQLRQMQASVSLVLALGGGWDVTQIPTINGQAVSTSNPSSGTAPSPATQPGKIP